MILIDIESSVSSKYNRIDVELNPDYDGSADITRWGYVGFFIVTTFVLLLLFFKLIQMMRAEGKKQIMDYYRIIQILIIEFLIAAELFTNSMLFIYEFEFYTLCMSVVTDAAYYYGETVG